MNVYLIVEGIYDSLKTSGIQTADHIRRAINSANITAAEPKSFALLDKS
jgi:hypothetical protein